MKLTFFSKKLKCNSEVVF